VGLIRRFMLFFGPMLVLAAGRPEEALAELRRAAAIWQRLNAAYHAAQTRLLIGRHVASSAMKMPPGWRSTGLARRSWNSALSRTRGRRRPCSRRPGTICRMA
jgi:hypothetical protein